MGGKPETRNVDTHAKRILASGSIGMLYLDSGGGMPMHRNERVDAMVTGLFSLCSILTKASLWWHIRLCFICLPRFLMNVWVLLSV